MPRRLLPLVPLALAACVDAPTTDTNSEGVVRAASPADDPSQVRNNMPPLRAWGSFNPVDGELASSPTWGLDPRYAHNASFTDGADLAGAPSLTQADDPAVGAWTSRYAYGNANPSPQLHTVAPDLQGILTQAANDARSRTLAKLDVSAYQDAMSWLGSLGASTRSFGPDTHMVGYDPEYARWMSSLSSKRRFGSPVSYLIAPPSAFFDQRQRGAHLYCAARNAQVQQASHPGARTLGKQTAFTLRLFKTNIDFLTVEPTATLDGPLPYLGGTPRCPVEGGSGCGAAPLDGSQAFMIPMLFGARITPVSLLPSLPELRFPAAVISGDSELSTKDVTVLGSGIFQTTTSSTYQTATHADAFVSSSGGATATYQMPLFYIGPVEVDLSLGLGVQAGQPYANGTFHCSSDPDQANSPPTFPAASAPDNDRLLMNAWSPTRGGDHTSRYIDGPWSMSHYAGETSLQTYSAYGSKNGQPTVGRHGWMQPYDPMWPRALENDDRHLRTSTSIGACAGVIGFVPDIDWIPGIHINLAVGGHLAGTLSLNYDVRDGALATTDEQARPVSAISISPTTHADASVSLSVFLHIYVSWIFGQVDLWKGDLIGTGDVSLAQWDSGQWGEGSTMRFGTGGNDGVAGYDAMSWPDVQSTLPAMSPFEAMSEPVDACLADQAPNPATPPACPATPRDPTSGPPHVEVCAYHATGSAVSPSPADVCTDPSAYAASLGYSGGQASCIADMYSWLCQPVSAQQWANGMPVRARVLDRSDATETQQLGDIARKCLDAFVPNGPQAAGQSWIDQNYLKYGICDARGNLITGPDLVGTVTDPQQPPPVGPSSCQ
jgi:hypothetical protein